MSVILKNITIKNLDILQLQYYLIAYRYCIIAIVSILQSNNNNLTKLNFANYFYTKY
jgi:hypothetical protein